MQKVLDLWELFHCREILPWQIKSTLTIGIAIPFDRDGPL